jgi:hypothetical protein
MSELLQVRERKESASSFNRMKGAKHIPQQIRVLWMFLQLDQILIQTRQVLMALNKKFTNCFLVFGAPIVHNRFPLLNATPLPFVRAMHLHRDTRQASTIGILRCNSCDGHHTTPLPKFLALQVRGDLMRFKPVSSHIALEISYTDADRPTDTKNTGMSEGMTSQS